MRKCSLDKINAVFEEITKSANCNNENYVLCTIFRLAILHDGDTISIQRGDTNDLLKQGSIP